MCRCWNILHTLKVGGSRLNGFLLLCVFPQEELRWCGPAAGPRSQRQVSPGGHRLLRAEADVALWRRGAVKCVWVVYRGELIHSCALTWSLVYPPSSVLLQLTLEAHCVKSLPSAGRVSDSGRCRILSGWGWIWSALSPVVLNEVSVPLWRLRWRLTLTFGWSSGFEVRLTCSSFGLG